MYDYHPATLLPAISANAGQESSASDDRPRSGDREGSASGSESVGYGQYMEGSRDDQESEAPEDPHMALTAQTLNADGTPKRPMNAFMIFARKRRPQISAANQMMRTGDISKILSKEWNSMDMGDKKFYLDQAKKLKDNFNSKYPDYVYRRRPNNSRKKKKVEHEQQSPTESSAAADNEESMEETSPIEMEGPGRDTGQPFHMRAPGGSSSVYPGDDSYLLSQTASYPGVPDYSSGPQYPHQPRMAGLQGQETSLSATTIAPLRIPTLADTGAAGNPYSYPSSHPQSAAATPGGAHGPQNPWDSGRPTRSDVRAGGTWSTLPALDMSMTRQRSATLSTSSARSEAFSPNIPSRQWTGSASSAASSSPGTPFPTLASPFYPAQSPTQRSVDLANSPTSHPAGSSEYFSTSPTFQRSVSSATRHGGGQEAASYAGSPVAQQPTSPYGSQWPYPRPPSSSQHQRALPSLQPISSSYAMQPPANNGSPPSAHTAGVGYSWDRTRYDGRQ